MGDLAVSFVAACFFSQQKRPLLYAGMAELADALDLGAVTSVKKAKG